MAKSGAAKGEKGTGGKSWGTAYPDVIARAEGDYRPGRKGKKSVDDTLRGRSEK